LSYLFFGDNQVFISNFTQYHTPEVEKWRWVELDCCEVSDKIAAR